MHPQVVTDTHLLQFGAMIGEASAELALSQAGSPGAVGREPACMFGMYDKREQYREVRKTQGGHSGLLGSHARAVAASGEGHWVYPAHVLRSLLRPLLAHLVACGWHGVRPCCWDRQAWD